MLIEDLRDLMLTRVVAWGKYEEIWEILKSYGVLNMLMQFLGLWRIIDPKTADFLLEQLLSFCVDEGQLQVGLMSAKIKLGSAFPLTFWRHRACFRNLGGYSRTGLDEIGGDSIVLLTWIKNCISDSQFFDERNWRFIVRGECLVFHFWTIETQVFFIRISVDSFTLVIRLSP